MRGRPLDSSQVPTAWLRKAQDAAGLPRAGFHAIRYGFAFALRERGVSQLDARDLMGHGSIAMTADVYQGDGSSSPEALLAHLKRAVAHPRRTGRAQGADATERDGMPEEPDEV
jgi:integrase